MPTYVVRQGEYLQLIAARAGVSADSLWQHPDNEALRQQRRSPNLLAPGDVLHLPEPPAGSQRLSANTTNRFIGNAPTVPLSLRLELEGRPLANEACRITGGQQSIDTQTDGDGLLQTEVPANVPRIRIEVTERKLRFFASVGRLDPHDHDSGVFERLVNLGYLSPEQRFGTGEQRRARLRRALSKFQRDHGVEQQQGQLDAHTTDKLHDEHGC